MHGKAGQACPVCGDIVREVSFADSALQYCPTCQTGGKPENNLIEYLDGDNKFKTTEKGFIKTISECITKLKNYFYKLLPIKID